MQTQWKVAGMGGLIGLDYPAVIAVINLYLKKKKDRRELFENVQAIEQGYLSGIRKDG